MKVSIIGASGYTGGELIRILLNHKEVEIDKVISNSFKGTKVSDLFNNLRSVFDKEFTGTDNLDEELKESEVIFLAVPHKAAMEYVPKLLNMGKKVIDLSADFRISNSEIYEKWYNVEHTAKELLKDAVYGLPEINRNRIKDSKLIANPGCYPTTVILGVAPLLKNKLVYKDDIIVDSKSGVSGAGKKCNQTTHFSETNENFKAYSIINHRHIPEIEEQLSIIYGEEIIINFTPHLVPMTRGMLSTIYLKLNNNKTEKEIVNLFKEFYSKDKFIRIIEDGLVETKNVRGTNFVDIGIRKDDRTNRLIVTSAIDNVAKGASAQAVQNLNLICGFNEDEGLKLISYLP